MSVNVSKLYLAPFIIKVHTEACSGQNRRSGIVVPTTGMWPEAGRSRARACQRIHGQSCGSRSLGLCLPTQSLISVCSIPVQRMDKSKAVEESKEVMVVSYIWSVELWVTLVELVESSFL